MGRHITTACSGRANQHAFYHHSCMRAADAGRSAADLNFGEVVRLMIRLSATITLIGVLSLHLFWPAFTIADRGRASIKLSNSDRAVIVQLVLRDLFRPSKNAKGKYFILAEDIQPQWIPKIVGYDLSVVSREDLRSFPNPPHFFRLMLNPGQKTINVVVHFTELKWEQYPEVGFFYKYRRVDGRWRGRYEGTVRG